MAVRQDDIDAAWRRAVKHIAEDAEGQACDAYKAHEALRLERRQRRQRLIHQLLRCGRQAVSGALRRAQAALGYSCTSQLCGLQASAGHCFTWFTFTTAMKGAV